MSGAQGRGLPADAVAELRREIVGTLVFPPDLDYAAAAGSHAPGVVVCAASADDVARAVRIAARHDLPVRAVLGAGDEHPPFLEGGVLLRLDGLTGVAVAGDRVRAGAGTLRGIELVDAEGHIRFVDDEGAAWSAAATAAGIVTAVELDLPPQRLT